MKVCYLSIRIEDVEKEIDDIIRSAELERLKIIESARRKAKEILDKPVELDDAKRESELIIRNAELKAEEILKDSITRAEEIKRLDESLVRELIKLIVRRAAGVD